MWLFELLHLARPSRPADGHAKVCERSRWPSCCTTALDPNEAIELELKPLAKLPELVRTGQLRSGTMLAGLLLWLDQDTRISWPR